MKMSVADVKGLCKHHFERHSVMLPLYQTLAENFYPERADFTFTRNVGTELADRLLNSYPVLVRRDLGNALSAMLRDGDWFEVGVNGEPDHLGLGWLQWSSKRLLGLFRDRQSNFVRATKEGDHDYATFGQCAISVEPNKLRDGLLFRCWHLRDVAWWDDETGQVGGVVRKWKPTIRMLVDYFGEDKVHPKVLDKLYKKPFEEIDIRHIVMPSSMYGDDELAEKHPYVSLFIDMTHDHVVEETGLNNKMYVVPRFQTISGSPYAYSPATVVGLPDARALQAMTHTLMEAGERYARPPMVATEKAIRGDIDLAPDGITYVDDEYDERFGPSIRPLTQDRGGFPIGLNMRDNIVEILAKTFYLDTLTLPDINRDMTAYEVSERMKQFRRQNLPLFSPIESEYNGQVCELAFDVAFSAGMLGSPYDIPESLQGQEVRFKFESPLSQSEEEEKATRWQQTSQMLAEAMAIDPGMTAEMDLPTAFRDAVMGLGVPARWLHPVEVAQEQRVMMAMSQAAEAAVANG